MDLYNLILTAKIQKGEGGGGDVDVDALNVTENGTYTASTGHAYNPVKVSVPGIVPSGTSQITSNGIYDVSNYASASVNVPQPTGTSVITSNGLYNVTDFSQASVSVPTGITPTGTSSITANGIYDITSFASVDVNVSGGGGGDHDVEDALVERTLSGTYINSRVAVIGANAFLNFYYLNSVNFSNVTSIGVAAFSACARLTTAIFPKVEFIGTSAFAGCTSLTTLSFPNLSSIQANAFANCTSLMSVYLLGSSVPSAAAVNMFASTPISKSSYTGSFGSIYVPASLVDTYQSKTAWSVYKDRITSYVE